ncbi:MAG TPA: asparagine synthase (glutamine-hydrolyzing) [Pyrinomonadaceae bacterium]|nr:asparagine synthase (glutamine-hydrolyzing) [Pyrinomonadaceae bacterium]
MCGIAGIFELDAERAAEHQVVEAMTGALAHRGPDGAGFYRQGNVAFGFRRLALNDPARGDQPFANEDGSVVTMCNGEIYNHGELRERLATRGHQFNTTCDSEVLPHLYEEYGASLVDHLDGQFAFAVYDQNKNRLLLGRDHFGIHPLFYTTVGRTFLFASEIKAILRHPRVRREVNLTGLDQILCFPGLVSPTTMFRDIHSLPSGRRLLVSARGVEESEYWDLDYPLQGETAGATADEAHYIDGVTERLARATRRRAEADADVGIYISGGLDSAIVAGVCALEDRGAPRRSFSIMFPNDEMDEARHQRRVVRHARTAHEEVSFKAADVLARLSEAIYHAECPLKETYNTACLALAEAARRGGVKAVLTGQGADELFAGYVGYKFDKFKGGAADDLDPVERRIRERLWGDARIPYEGNYAELARLKRELYSHALLDRLDASGDAFDSLTLNRARLAGRHAAHQRSYLDFKLRLADHLLSDHGDRMAMAHAIEMRHPFLDRALVDFARHIPPDLNLKNFEEKYILRRAAAAFVPRQIATREKFGWFAPGTPALLQAGDARIADLLSAERIRRQGYFNAETVERLKQRYAAPGFRLNHPYETDLLAIVLTFNVFLEVFEIPSLN